jgi:hypothetical protein
VSTDLNDLRGEIKDAVALYQTPIVYDDILFDKIVLKAVKQYYIDTGKVNLFNSQYVTGAMPTLTIDLNLVEREYIIIWGQIIFIDQIRADVSQLVSLTSDAMNLTNMDKPYKNLSEDRKNLTDRLIELFYKLPNVSTMTPVINISIPKLNVTYE